MKKILLVEDDLQLVRMYQIAFDGMDITLLSALDGAEALEKVKEHPDLILLDLVIPKKDGFTVLAELKNDPVTAKIPVFCLSVLHQDVDQKRGIELGAEKFLVKTDITPDAVVELVLNRLNG